MCTSILIWLIVMYCVCTHFLTDFVGWGYFREMCNFGKCWGDNGKDIGGYMHNYEDDHFVRCLSAYTNINLHVSDIKRSIIRSFVIAEIRRLLERSSSL